MKNIVWPGKLDFVQSAAFAYFLALFYLLLETLVCYIFSKLGGNLLITVMVLAVGLFLLRHWRLRFNLVGMTLVAVSLGLGMSRICKHPEWGNILLLFTAVMTFLPFLGLNHLHLKHRWLMLFLYCPFYFILVYLGNSSPSVRSIGLGPGLGIIAFMGIRINGEWQRYLWSDHSKEKLILTSMSFVFYMSVLMALFMGSNL